MENLTLIESLRTEYIKFSEVEEAILNHAPDKFMNLFTLLSEHTVLPNLGAKNKQEAIHALIDSLTGQVEPDVLEIVREKVFEREGIMSTGVGKGLAIPHCKTKAVDHNYAAFARLEEPIDFNSIDKEPVQIVFLLVGPDSKHGEHIKLLSRISRLMNSTSFSEKILNSQTSELIIEAFREEEEKYFVH
ncbi:MAG: PTS sugar transporter subunit IIA [Balneolales bacterium]|nr:PTS sugar transporter subunit IIA [Balneolales bacterium]